MRSQVSEAKNQKSSGRAEPMQWMVFNMARYLLFVKGVSLLFEGDAVAYATCV